ncbi:MAG TPA: TetR family transcriptional regulator [Actinomycetota bacterium]|nr:TetR family transcriptional regulator [Actinomycetota bacterium]
MRAAARVSETSEVNVGTRARIVAAAIRTLKERGFAGTSARAIAHSGRFNQALIFYHFGTVNDLLLAALDETSAQRMRRYRGALEEIKTLPELLAQAAQIYREDLESGHIKVLAELIAGASSSPPLGPEIVARIEPWVALTEEALERVLAGSALESLVPTQDLAFTVVALYLGVELLAHLNGQLARAEQLIDSGSRLASLFAGMFPRPRGSD